MEIRRAVKDDIPGINALLRQVLEIHHKGRPDLFKTGCKKYTDEQLADIIADDERPIFAAAENGSILGYAFCIFERHKNDNVLTDITTLYIDDLCVDESLRGKHIGKALFDHVKEFARSAGCHNITLNVWECNPPAQRFYEKMGMLPQKTYLETVL
ncbi:MAG: GNAT family N-acetyltransferase [Ruminiclostridium sp.]|nr:GNAT family N-acetyltransferase [Ruminiclostridium sp.]